MQFAPRLTRSEKSESDYLCRMRVFIIGYMGSGKTTVGKALAEALGIPWTDLDEEFETRYRVSIPDFFGKYGEAAFRRIESSLLGELCLLPEAVISTGGGTPCFNGNADRMNASGLTLYLEATPELILKRLKTGFRKRPVFEKMKEGNTLENIRSHLGERRSFYEQSAISTDATSPDIAALKEQIIRYFRTHP
jgi:shikimate kinase